MIKANRKDWQGLRRQFGTIMPKRALAARPPPPMSVVSHTGKQVFMDQRGSAFRTAPLRSLSDAYILCC